MSMSSIVAEAVCARTGPLSMAQMAVISSLATRKVGPKSITGQAYSNSVINWSLARLNGVSEARSLI